MASLFKKKLNKPLPAGAEIVPTKDGPKAKWTDTRGRKHTAPLTKDQANIVVESSVWYVRYRDASGLTKRQSTGCKDERNALRVVDRILDEVEQVGAGIKTAEQIGVKQHARRPLQAHVDDYLQDLSHKTKRGKRTSPEHVGNVRRQLKILSDECRLDRIHDVTKAVITRWMERQEESEDGMSGRTVNTYRSAIVAFCGWAVREGRFSSNPLDGLYTADETEKSRRRRPLEPAEIGKLLEVARARPLNDAMMIRIGPRKGQLAAKVKPEDRERLVRLGWERVLMYEVMIYTGLRRGELASLAVGDLHLDGDRPYIELHAKGSKNARGDQSPLRKALADELAQWVSKKVPAAALFTVPVELVKILNRDLAAAGIPKADDLGRTIDVHAFRHTTGTELARAGVLPQVAMTVMRHASFETTMKHYTHLVLNDTGAAVEKMPDFSLATESQSQMKTGTDDQPVDGGAQGGDQKGAFPGSRRVKIASKGVKTSQEETRGNGSTDIINRESSEVCQEKSKAADEIRTHDVQLGKLAFYH